MAKYISHNMHRKANVFIDPFCRISYSSFYIQGLYEEFGKENVSFSAKYFNGLKRKQESHSYDHYMAFVIIDAEKNATKIIIDFRDKPSVKESAYDWADKYAKVNFNTSLTDKRYHAKMISIPPGFGLNIWSLWSTVYYCVSNLVKCRFSPTVSLIAHIGSYYKQYQRPRLDHYAHARKDQAFSPEAIPYVFFIGTLWGEKNCLEETNIQRKRFVELCKQSKCNFEGGFFGSPDHPQYKEFRNLVFFKRYSVKAYIQKTKLSAIVFNTPAVHNCHGWKLGEFLAMNKAIISMPLSNSLPEELVHGKNIHLIQQINELGPAINMLFENSDYRKLLEDGARSYYLKYVAPGAVIRNILETKTAGIRQVANSPWKEAEFYEQH